MYKKSLMSTLYQIIEVLSFIQHFDYKNLYRGGADEEIFEIKKVNSANQAQMCRN